MIRYSIRYTVGCTYEKRKVEQAQEILGQARTAIDRHDELERTGKHKNHLY